MATYSAIQQGGYGFNAEGQGQVFVLSAVIDFAKIYSVKPTLANNYSGTLISVFTNGDVINLLPIPAGAFILNGGHKILTQGAGTGTATGTLRVGANDMTIPSACDLKAAAGTIVGFGNSTTASYWSTVTTGAVPKLSLPLTADSSLDYVATAVMSAVTTAPKMEVAVVAARMFKY